MDMRTLLVGLGGTGCRVVDQVLGRINESKVPDQYICCIGFDTDSSTLSSLKNALEVILTSKEQTVEEYLNKMSDFGVGEWFPDTALIKKRNMIDGAGQMRPLSRLAFLECSNSERMGKLKEAVKKLNLARGHVDPSNMRVMIVSSFAGGTGSGMFLQMAMWIRKFFRKEYWGEVLIRGLFAFPDIYMPSTSDDIQKESKYANSYGAIRELNAINIVTMCSSDQSKEKAKKIKISFDDLFDSERDYAKANAPFNLMFFIDNINKARRVMPSLEHYEKLMANITYMQVYSPLSPSQYTAEDNGYITIIESGGEALYGSAGASSLEYPYKDILQYCGFCAASDSIGQNWTFFDDEFKKDLKENQDQRRANPAIPKIERDISFIKAVEAHLRDGSDQFRFIKSQVQDENNNLISNRDETFYMQMMQLIDSKFENDEELEIKKQSCGVSMQALSSPHDIQGEVARVERALRDYQQSIDDAVQRDKSSLVQAIICDTYESIRSFNGGKYNVEQLVCKNGNMVHPLSARLLLYRFRNLIRDGLKAAENTFATCLTDTNDYKTHDYNKGTKKVTEDAYTEAIRVSSLFAARINHAFLAFKDDYFKMAGRQQKNLEQYSYCSLQKAVLSEVLKRLDALISEYEIFFDSLAKVKINLDIDSKNLEKKHTSETDLVTYVYASSSLKKKVYNSLVINTANEDNYEVSGAIFKALYNETCLEIENERSKRYASETEEQRTNRHFTTMEYVFRSNVVNHITSEIENKYKPILDINVYEALKQQCADETYQQQCTDDLRTPQSILASVAQKGVPYLLYDDQKNFAYQYFFWGINPKTEQLILQDNPDLNGVSADYFKVGNTEITPKTEVNERFSSYTIDFYCSSYGVRLKDIQKFTETGELGVFYQNYQKRIKEMLAGSELAITPHLDIRWHLRNYLPYINSEKDVEDDLKAAEAMWLALAYGIISLREDAKGVLRYFSTLNSVRGEIIEWEGTRLSVEDTYMLFLFIKNDEKGVSKILKSDQFAKESAKTRGGAVNDKKFVQGLISADIPEQNAVTIMFNLASDPENPELELDTVKRALEGLIAKFCEKASADSEVVDDLVASIKRAIVSASYISKMSKTSMGYQLFRDWI